VVAATCKSSDSNEYVKSELFDSSKEVNEHKSSLTNRIKRYTPYCEEGSIRVVSEMQVKRLRNVCHLHSVFTGELLAHVQFFDFFETMFPILSARPKELLPIADSEMGPHRYYGGAIGHRHLDSGGCFLNLRNALIKHDVIHAKVGVGVINESTAQGEFLETRDKISGLMEAVQLWDQGPVDD
jgi:anthranilate/para-aminobenzoate synthase component I